MAADHIRSQAAADKVCTPKGSVRLGCFMALCKRKKDQAPDAVHQLAPA
jgi:hypothetical protein